MNHNAPTPFVSSDVETHQRNHVSTSLDTNGGF